MTPTLLHCYINNEACEYVSGRHAAPQFFCRIPTVGVQLLIPFGHRLVAMDGNNWTLFHYDYGTGYIGG